MSAETKKIIGGLQVAAMIFLSFTIWIMMSSFAFRPQTDVLGAMGFGEEIVAEVKSVPAAPARDTRAEEMARVVYGTALYNSEEQQKAVMWCIINRVENALYPSTVEEVCGQSGQWMGYSEVNPVLEPIYDAAVEVLEAWECGGPRNLPKDCLWFDWTGTESITFRTAFEGKANKWVVE